VVQPIIWKEITTALEGRAIGGSWAVEDGRVKVRTALGEKSAPLEEANGVWVAWRLLREMAAEGRAPQSARFLCTMKKASAQKQARPNKTVACPQIIPPLCAGLRRFVETDVRRAATPKAQLLRSEELARLL
jgi:hypothetical protein